MLLCSLLPTSDSSVVLVLVALYRCILYIWQCIVVWMWIKLIEGTDNSFALTYHYEEKEHFTSYLHLDWFLIILAFATGLDFSRRDEGQIAAKS